MKTYVLVIKIQFNLKQGFPIVRNLLKQDWKEMDLMITLGLKDMLKEII